MPLLLTDAQIREIKFIIEKHHVAVIFKTMGPEALSPEERLLIQKMGIGEKELIETIKDSYLYGQLLGKLDNIKTAKMNYEQFKSHVQKDPIPLSRPEEFAIEAAQHSAGQYLRSLGAKEVQKTNSIILQEDQVARAKLLSGVQTEVAENVERRESLGQLKKRLRELGETRERDWMRVAITEKHAAHQQGVADSYHREGGDETLVFKRRMPDSCRWCAKLHEGPDGAPRIFKLSYLQDNGTNVGRKAADWQPVVGGIHPFCQCVLGRVPKGWGFDEEGDMVPDGEFGIHYESEEAAEKAMRAEDALQKAFAIKGRLAYQGLDIAIENPVGSVRRWTAKDGTKGETIMRYAYGYIEDTMGPDGDEYDCFLGPDPEAPFAFVVHQNREDEDEWDEDKVMLGFANAHQARDAYLAHYTDSSFLGSISMMPMEEFKAKVFQTGVPGTLYADGMVKSGPFIGPRGGLWADPQHKIPWKNTNPRKQKATKPTVSEAQATIAKMRKALDKDDEYGFVWSVVPPDMTAKERATIAAVSFWVSGNVKVVRNPETYDPSTHGEHISSISYEDLTKEYPNSLVRWKLPHSKEAYAEAQDIMFDLASAPYEKKDPVYRGLALSPDEMGALVPGAELDMGPIVSFSTSPHTAKYFGGVQSKRHEGTQAMVIKLQAKRGSDITGASPSAHENEVVSSGKIRIIKVEGNTIEAVQL